MPGRRAKDVVAADMFPLRELGQSRLDGLREATAGNSYDARACGLSSVEVVGG